MNVPPGTVVDGKYEVISTIAAGGFGVLYKAKQLGFDRLVALKLLNLQTADKEMVLRFEREAKILSSLQHPNIVSVYGFGVWDGFPYISMEYLAGESLETAIGRDGNLPIPMALNTMMQVCSALQSAHHAGIVHRDLKPANIMICSGESRNNIKVIDFGLARLSWLSSELQKLTEAGTTLGTAQYMSPEQCTGATVDSRSDIYAAGCIFFKVLTGQNAFNGEHTALMMQHLRDTPPRLSQYFATTKILDELQLVLDKCMAKEPKDRYQSASELMDDLNAIARSKQENLIAEHARPPKAGGLSAKIKVGLSMCVAVVLTLFGIFFYIQNQPDNPRAASSIELFRQYQSLASENSYRHDHAVRLKLIPIGYDTLNAASKDNLLLTERRVFVLTSLGQSLQAEGRYREALGFAQEAVRELQATKSWSPQIQAATEVARDALTSLGQRNRAKEFMQRVADTFPHEATSTPHYLHYDLAGMAVEDGDYKTARHHLNYLEYYTPSDIRPGVLKLREQVAQHESLAKSPGAIKK